MDSANNICEDKLKPQHPSLSNEILLETPGVYQHPSLSHEILLETPGCPLYSTAGIGREAQKSKRICM